MTEILQRSEVEDAVTHHIDFTAYAGPLAQLESQR